MVSDFKIMTFALQDDLQSFNQTLFNHKNQYNFVFKFKNFNIRKRI